MDRHDELRDNIKRKGKHPKAPLQSLADVKRAWRLYNEYLTKAFSAYGSYHRHNNLMHHARYEAYDDLSMEWHKVIDDWLAGIKSL